MARKPRIDLDGFYHIIDRSVARSNTKSNNIPQRTSSQASAKYIEFEPKLYNRPPLWLFGFWYYPITSYTSLTSGIFSEMVIAASTLRLASSQLAWSLAWMVQSGV